MSNASAVLARQAPAGFEERQAGEAGRLRFIDNIRWLLMVLVVAVHVAVTYLGMGDLWYYSEAVEAELAAGLTLGALCCLVQAFSMGLFFFIAGSFVPGACDRKGVGRFTADRLYRLGIPTLVFMLILHPLTELSRDAFLGGLPADLPAAYAGYLLSGEFLSESGPLWMAFALLAFTLVYALVRAVAGRRGGAGGGRSAGLGALTHGRVLALVGLVAAVSFLVRLRFPFGADILNMKPAYFPQYIVLFAAGLWAARNRFFLDLPERFGRTWLRIGLFACIPGWFVLMAAGMGPEGRIELFFGGLRWQAAAYAVWDSLFCAAMVLGLPVLYRRRFGRQGRLTRFLADNTFGVYVFHTPLVVLLTVLLRDWRAYPLLKFAAGMGLSLPVCFLASAAIRRVPLLRRLFT